MRAMNNSQCNKTRQQQWNEMSEILAPSGTSSRIKNGATLTLDDSKTRHGQNVMQRNNNTKEWWSITSLCAIKAQESTYCGKIPLDNKCVRCITSALMGPITSRKPSLDAMKVQFVRSFLSSCRNILNFVASLSRSDESSRIVGANYGTRRMKQESMVPYQCETTRCDAR